MTEQQREGAHSSRQCNGSVQVPSQTTVLIVGGGPVGLATAILLAKLGLLSVVVEQSPGRYGHPKAHAINPRTLEIFRQAGLDTQALRTAGLSAEDGGLVRFVKSMTGVEFGSLPYERQDAGAMDVTPEPLFNIAQPLLEGFLSTAAQATGKVTILRPIEWLACEQQPDGNITSSLVDRSSTSEHSIRSKYLIGCDGARSNVRQYLQVPWEPLEGLRDSPPGYYASAHFYADLSHIKTAALWVVLGPANIGGFICYDPRREWAYVVHYNPETTPAETLTEDWFRERIDKAIGQSVELEIRGISKWVTSPKIARTYRSTTVRNGLLAGDAAHAFPPTGGLGVNTGIADCHNLAWKIYAVEQGWADSTLLDSVTSERRPIANDNSRQSFINDTRLRVLGTTVWEYDPNASAENLMEDPKFREKLHEALDFNAEHYDSLNLQIGYVYGRAPTRRCNEYVKEAVPGARLPHAWVEVGGRRVSTLDLVAWTSFTLLTAEGWVREETIEIPGTPVHVIQKDRDFRDPEGHWSSLMGLSKGARAVLIRPDQHIVGHAQSAQEANELLMAYMKESSSPQDPTAYKSPS